MLSGAESGVVAVNDRKSGICMFVISDHVEIPISMLQCSQHMIHVCLSPHVCVCVCVGMGVGVGVCGCACKHTCMHVDIKFPLLTITIFITQLQLASCGSQPVNLWMVSGKDGRHSVWGSRWVENIHALVDWVTLPNTKVRQSSPLSWDT